MYRLFGNLFQSDTSFLRNDGGMTAPVAMSQAAIPPSSELNSPRPPQQVLPKKSAADFIFGKQIGEGSFSTVYIATDAETRKEQYAIKMCEKALIQREKKQAAIMREKEIMNKLNEHPSPFFIKLICTFQDQFRLFFVMNYAKGGELLPFINKNGSFGEECTRFYGGEILLALEHLHSLGIIHRDLKPENILLTEQLHIQITDFGSAVIEGGHITVPLPHPAMSSSHPVSRAEARRNSFTGTAQYVSPEMLNSKNASKPADLWALGCILYQMTAGKPPFQAPNEYKIFQKILGLKYEFPVDFNPLVRDLTEKLLTLDPMDRIGARDAGTGKYLEIREHPFFKPLHDRWDKLHEEIPPKAQPGNDVEKFPHYSVPDDARPGFDADQFNRLLGLSLSDDERSKPNNVQDNYDHASQLEKQARDNAQWHHFVEGNLIIKQGLIDKRKGLLKIPRSRMFLLTTGPHLYYVDPVQKVLKGQVPWSASMHPEPKNFKNFLLHTPNRTYILEDPKGDAPGWCRAIADMRDKTFPQASGTSRGNSFPNSTAKSCSKTKYKSPSS